MLRIKSMLPKTNNFLYKEPFKYNADYQIYHYLPKLKYIYTKYEINYDTSNALKFTQKHMQLPFIIVGLYLLSIVIGKNYMKNKSVSNQKLRNTLTFWNFSLSLFSFIGALRTVPELLFRISFENNFIDTINKDPSHTWGTGACGLWCQLFILSKIPELLDTYFIVARKRPLIFLHWYHHVTVLLYCWHSFATKAPQALYFIAMNFTVHSIMYGYYCLSTLRIKPKWLNPKFITFIQVTQMFVGVIIQLKSMYLYIFQKNTLMNKNNLIFGTIMYLSYLLLFVSFAFKKYPVSKHIKKLT